MAKANYQRARTLVEMEDYYPAYEMLRQAVEFDPDKPEYWTLPREGPGPEPEVDPAGDRDAPPGRRAAARERRGLARPGGRLRGRAQRDGAGEGPEGGPEARPDEPEGDEGAGRDRGDETALSRGAALSSDRMVETVAPLRDRARSRGRSGTERLRRPPRLRRHRAPLSGGLPGRHRPVPRRARRRSRSSSASTSSSSSRTRSRASTTSGTSSTRSSGPSPGALLARRGRRADRRDADGDPRRRREEG